jgi:two-component system response regulator YesN
MLKVMVVDDELLVRVGIKSLLEWEEHGFIYAGDAPDGERALEFIGKYEPDIVLADIVMPNMSGVDMLAAIKKAYPYIRVVMLSSHNDYHYLREAMRLGADDYLLKSSLRPEELLACLQETARKMVEQRTVSAPLKRSSLSVKLVEAIREKRNEEQLAGMARELDWQEGAHILYVIRMHRTDSMLDEDSFAFDKTLNLIEQLINNWMKRAMVAGLKQNEILVAAPVEEGLSEIDIRQIGADIIISCNKYLSVSCSVGISSVFTRLSSIKRAYAEAYEAVQPYYYDGPGKVFLYEACSQPEGKIQQSLYSGLNAERFLHVLGTYDATTVKNELNRLFEQLNRERPPLSLCIPLLLELLGCFQKRLKGVGLDLPDISDQGNDGYQLIFRFSELKEARAWFELLAVSFCDKAGESHDNRYSKEIAQLLAFVAEHYNEPMPLTRAARHVHLSEGYLGYLFKKETGKNFVEYITDLRMDKAQQYLRNTDWPIYLIAEKLGFTNINYFGRSFKKKVGMSPNQFREYLETKPKAPGESLA